MVSVNRVLCVFLFAVAGCGSGGDDGGPSGGDDAGGDDEEDAAPRTCAEIRADYQALVDGLDRTCDTPDDCAIDVPDDITCDCFAHLQSSCSGDVFQRAAREQVADQIAALQAEFDASCHDGDDCFEIECTCDCAPETVTCSDAGLCVAVPGEACLPVEPPDAGP